MFLSGDRNHNRAGLSTVKKRQTTKRPWSAVEKEAVKRQLGKSIRLGVCPGKKECETARMNEPALLERDWRHIKFCVKNILAAKQVY